MRKLAILAVMAALTATLSGCWWGPGPGWGGGPGHGGGPGGGPGGDGPHGAVVVPHATARA
jgi:class 4 POU domain transcription factor